jgi:hypothetical protein
MACTLDFPRTAQIGSAGSVGFAHAASGVRQPAAKSSTASRQEWSRVRLAAAEEEGSGRRFRLAVAEEEGPWRRIRVVTDGRQDHGRVRSG